MPNQYRKTDVTAGVVDSNIGKYVVKILPLFLWGPMSISPSEILPTDKNLNWVTPTLLVLTK